MAAKTIRHTADPRTGVARGLYVNFGVADEHYFRGCGAEFSENRFDSHGVRLLAFKTVAAIYDPKISSKAQPLQNPAARAHGLVGEHRHGHPGKSVEGLADTRIQHGIVEFVDGIILEKEFKTPAAFFFGRAIAQRARDQVRSALPDVAENLVVRVRPAAHFRQDRI